MLLIIAVPLPLLHGNHHKIRLKAQPAAQPLVPLPVHTLPIVRDAQNLPMAQVPQIFPHLTPSVPVVQLEVAYPPPVLEIAVVNDKRDMNPAAQLLVLMVAEAQDHHTHHVPHGGELDRRHQIGGLFNHHKIIVPLNLIRQIVDGQRDKWVCQYPPFVFFMVVNHNTNNTGTVLRQERRGHIGDIAPFLQLLLHPPDRPVGYLFRFSVDHIGNRGSADPQLIGDVYDPHLVLCPHKLPPTLYQENICQGGISPKR